MTAARRELARARRRQISPDLIRAAHSELIEAQVIELVDRVAEQQMRPHEPAIMKQ